jgi:hypothetical protein
MKRLILILFFISSSAMAGEPFCNYLGDFFNFITLQPSCYERIRKYNYDHSERSVTDLADIYGPHSPEHPPENYHRVKEGFGNDAWEKNNRGW